ncbi:MAG: hypothetical protein R3E08_13540 [Thiotrichaceae bacterium]
MHTQVRMYSTHICPCMRAESLLKQRGVDAIEMKNFVDGNPH